MNSGIIASGLYKNYGSVCAVSNLFLNVPPGMIIGLLGPNGAGKTSTLRMLAGILKPDQGQITVCGLNISDNIFEVKKRIGFLSGDTQLYGRLTVTEVLRFFGRLNGMTGSALAGRIDELIRDFRMSDYAYRPVSSLSSGQKQRANIARTLVHDPDVLVLDEATVSLDIISSRFIMETLAAMKERGKAILFSTHIMGEAEYLCDRIALMYKGAIIDIGTVAELTGRAGATNLTDAFLTRLDDDQPTIGDGFHYDDTA